MKLDGNLPFLGTLLKKEQDLVAYADQLAGGARCSERLSAEERAMFVDSSTSCARTRCRSARRRRWRWRRR